MQARPLNIDDLSPDPDNPRYIDNIAADGLRASLREFGDLSGIVFNERTGQLVAGHQRVQQLRSEGAQVVGSEVVHPSGERFNIRIVDWPISKQRQANVAANNPHISGVYTEALGDYIDDIRASLSADDFDVLRFDALAEVATFDRMPEPEPVEAPSVLTYSVTVDLDTPDEQARLVSSLRKQGYTCRQSVS